MRGARHLAGHITELGNPVGLAVSGANLVISDTQAILVYENSNP
jgi:hypothetical protein